jgi:predicted unusual protein kinase regulating ubiquinone biosynthesis (AarF/ABC1/UbiB family)
MEIRQRACYRNCGNAPELHRASFRLSNGFKTPPGARRAQFHACGTRIVLALLMSICLEYARYGANKQREPALLVQSFQYSTALLPVTVLKSMRVRPPTNPTASQRRPSALSQGVDNENWDKLLTTLMDKNSIDDSVTGSAGLFGVDTSSLAGSLAHIWESLIASVSPIDGSSGPIVAIMVTGALVFSFLYQLSFPPVSFRDGLEPYVRGNYDPIQAIAYYNENNARRLAVLQRMLQVFRISNRFLLSLLLDKYLFRNEEDTTVRTQRAEELLSVVTQLGPTAIKVGQALSVRADLLPAEYVATLSTLQDQVPPFDNDVALTILRQQLGNQRVQKLQITGISSSPSSSPPVASASIGQVYKGMIRDSGSSSDTSKFVAVKVQRPNVLAEIALDLYIVREFFVPLYMALNRNVATDLRALANEWGRGFIAELDYRSEAANTIKFNKAMEQRQLAAVCAPTVLTEYSTEQILVTEWVDGTRLDRSNEADVPRLCAVALNAYLVMLLELKSLHCDPHPGNLLRTNDGRLCILDFGMTLDIDPNLQYSLLQYVAHLTSNDYSELPEDLVALGFLKPEKLDYARRSGILQPLQYFLKQIGQGGGASAVRERIFDEYREKFPDKTEDELRVEMRAEMKVSTR